MINELVGLYLAEKYDVKSDRVVFTETVGASGTSSITLANALSGAGLIAELNSYDYFVTNYTTWTSAGLMQVEIKPDGESINKIKTLSFTQKIESALSPPKYVQAGIDIDLANQIALENDVYIILDIFKVPQTNTSNLYDLIESLVDAPPNIDVQTLGTQKFVSNSNIYLEAILIALGGNPSSLNLNPTEGQIKSTRCKRL